MQTLSQIRALLDTRGIKPKHRYGQNFLHDHNQLRRLLAAAAVSPGQTVLEVGPGTGTLTSALLEAGARVVACEIDADMIEILRAEFAADIDAGRLTIVEGDCLEGKRRLNPEADRLLRAAGQFKLAANLPYHAATPLLLTLLTRYRPAGDESGCTGMFVTIQKEVAQRLSANAGDEEYGPLSVVAQVLAEVEVIAELPGSCFWPSPDVVSAMAAVRPRKELAIAEAEIGKFSELVQRGFAQRRKQLRKALGAEVIAKVGLADTVRAEEVSPEGWIGIFRAVRA